MYKSRREKLVKTLLKNNKNISRGAILLFAPFENVKYRFRQESSFYYLTGCKEPGVIFLIGFNRGEVIEKMFIPNYVGKRDKWVVSQEEAEVSVEIIKMGQPTAGYWLRPGFREEEHRYVIKEVNQIVGRDGTIFTLLDEQNDSYFIPRYRFEKLFAHLLACEKCVVDVSPTISSMRRKKDKHELELMQSAIDITCKAHERVAEIIRPGLYEYEVRAEIEKIFTQNNARIAFPSIVASGKSSTVLHYSSCDQKLKDGDLVVVDIGAEVDGYCADLTRTFPVSGSFSARQREVCELVLEVSKHVISVAKPGMYLRNSHEPDRSLHHIAESFLKELGYKEFFSHGIGHFLGLDVHDVGNLSDPLEEGDVITIEPGIYIPGENIGVRIEDDFIVESGENVGGIRPLSGRLAKMPVIW